MSEGKMSFVTPFNHKEYSAGLRRNIEIRLPVSLHADVDLENTKVRWAASPLEPIKVSKIFEYSTVPYTAIQNLLELVEPSTNEQIINVRKTKMVTTLNFACNLWHFQTALQKNLYKNLGTKETPYKEVRYK